MLKPAALYKGMLEQKMKEWYYTDDMMYYSGCLNNVLPDVDEVPYETLYQYAIVSDKGNLIGFLSYRIDYYSSVAYNFGLFSFDRGNITIGRDVFQKLEELTSKFHTVTWRMVSGNPAERNYDSFCKKHNGDKIVIRDYIKDREGNYRDSIIYNIINEAIK